MAGDTGEDGRLAPAHEAAIRAAFAAERTLIAAGASLIDVRRSGASVALALGGGSEEDAERAGLVALLAQCAARLAVLATLPPGAQCRVVEHKIDYGGAVEAGAAVAEAVIVRPGGSITVARVRASLGAGEAQRTLATVQATFLHDERKRAR